MYLCPPSDATSMQSYKRLLVLLALSSFACTSLGANPQCERDDGSCSSSATSNDVCGIWFARSSIPNSGLGMFAGRNFDEGEELMATGDVVIPLVDVEMYHKDLKSFFIWDSYTWNADSLGVSLDGVYEVNAASPGFGSAANSFRDLHNVEEWGVEHSLGGLHRSKDPGAGAFTPYHDRKSTAKFPIPAGQELFVNYGDSWFLERTESLGPIPIKGDLPRADKLLKKWDTIRRRQNETNEEILKDLWESFVWRSPFDDSRQFFALPKNWDETHQVLQHGLVDLRKQQSTPSLEWLAQHGICGDNIKEGLSAIPQAGRGAFATRFLTKGSVVAPLPLLHIPNRTRFDMYARDKESSGGKNKSMVVGQQLMLNYCLGHRDSTMVLCPYGLLTALVNHASEPNVKLQWADPKRSVHDPEWLNKTVDDFRDQKFAVLTMELVALRNIEKDEEIVLNYGDEWEEAWNEHVKAWSPVKGAESYVSAVDFNADLESKLKTVFEALVDPYPPNVRLKFDMAFTTRSHWLGHLKAGTLKRYKMEEEADMVDCDVLRVSKGADGRYYYTAVYFDPEKETARVKGVPREAFVFKDLPYTGDFLQPNVFRHDIRIPDEIFPNKWKNRLRRS